MKKLSLAMTLAVASLAAHANTISGLYSTGVSSLGTALNATDQDNHYNVVSDETTALKKGNAGYVAKNGTAPLTSSWDLNGKDLSGIYSTWLTPTKTQNQTFDNKNTNGLFKWTTKFDLSDALLDDTTFNGQVMADNSVTVYLNTHEIAINSTLSDKGNYKTWLPFKSVTADLKSGINILEFDVINVAGPGTNPTGLRVAIDSSFDGNERIPVLSVPEPETYAMMLGGLGLLGFMSRRKSTKKTR